ncbi:hypothetical protein J6Q66_00495 [bacterium]|nr:hypothetical protein [bacterium]
MGDFNAAAIRANSKVFDTLVDTISQEYTLAQLGKLGFSQDDIQTLSEKFKGKDTLTMADLKAAGFESQVSEMVVDSVSSGEIASIWNNATPKGDVGSLPNMLANNKQEKV